MEPLLTKVYATHVSATLAGSIRVNVYKLLILVGRDEFQVIGTQPMGKASQGFRNGCQQRGARAQHPGILLATRKHWMHGTNPMRRAPKQFGLGRQRMGTRAQRLGLAINGGRASSGGGRTRGKSLIPAAKEV